MEQDERHTELDDTAIEVTLDEPWARFRGGYSDVHIGQFRGEKVKILDAIIHKHEADASL